MNDPLMTNFGIHLIKGVVTLGVLLLVMAYLTFAERKILAYMQVRLGPNRVGPKGWLQPIADGLKLFVKEDLVPGRADRFVFMLAPVLIFAPAILVWAVIPWGESFTVAGVEITPFLADINIAVLFVLAVSTIGVYGLILGGWASNNKFSLMGGLRSAAQMVSYEVPLGFSVVSVLLMAGSLSLVSIVEAQREASVVWFVFPGILGFGIYFICGVAETNRNPFDLPEAEVRACRRLPHRVLGHEVRALLTCAEYMNMLLVSSVAVVLVLRWLAADPSPTCWRRCGRRRRWPGSRPCFWYFGQGGWHSSSSTSGSAAPFRATVSTSSCGSAGSGCCRCRWPTSRWWRSACCSGI